ncbi:hypothetical protein [Streptomyces synnematoformans]|uniref:Helix-turn-helix DNA binding domain protein n=1 Tax=Streptomyces synnematoformans TaxID=415721 RepID=A0ABP5IWP6_9ACTN
MSDYSPSPQLAAALTAFEEALTEVEERRRALREAVAADLKAYDVTNDVVADHLPWSAETVRGIAREYGVPPRRKPTVRSIKPKKKPGGTSSG